MLSARRARHLGPKAISGAAQRGLPSGLSFQMTILPANGSQGLRHYHHALVPGDYAWPQSFGHRTGAYLIGKLVSLQSAVEAPRSFC